MGVLAVLLFAGVVAKKVDDDHLATLKGTDGVKDLGEGLLYKVRRAAAPGGVLSGTEGCCGYAFFAAAALRQNISFAHHLVFYVLYPVQQSPG